MKNKKALTPKSEIRNPKSEMSMHLSFRSWRRLLLLPDVQPIFQSDDEVAWSAQNRKALREKGMLRRLYLSYYGRHLAHLARVPGRTLEVGSGGGSSRRSARRPSPPMC